MARGLGRRRAHLAPHARQQFLLWHPLLPVTHAPRPAPPGHRRGVRGAAPPRRRPRRALHGGEARGEGGLHRGEQRQIAHAHPAGPTQPRGARLAPSAHPASPPRAQGRIGAFVDALVDEHGLSATAPVHSAAPEVVVTAGRVICDSDGKLNEASLLLEGDIQARAARGSARGLLPGGRRTSLPSCIAPTGSTGSGDGSEFTPLPDPPPPPPRSTRAAPA